MPTRPEFGPTSGLTPKEVCATFLLGSASLLTFGADPVLMGRMVRIHQIAAADIGYSTTVEWVSLSVASAVLPRFMIRSNARLKIAFVSVLFPLASYSVYYAHALWALLSLKLLMGVGEGACLAAAVAVINQARSPDRVYGLFYSAVAIPQSIVGYLLPAYVLSRFSLHAGFAVFAVLCMLLCLSLLCFKEASDLHPKVETSSYAPDAPPQWSAAILLTFFAILIQQGGNMAGSAFIDPLAVEHAFSDQVLGMEISLGLVAQILAGGFVAWTAWRWPLWVVLVALGLLQAVMAFWMGSTRNAMPFLVSGIIFQFLWLMMLPFYIRLAMELDSTRRTALYLPGWGALGLSLGPFAGSFGVDDHSVVGAFYISGLMIALASLFYGLVLLAKPAIRSAMERT